MNSYFGKNKVKKDVKRIQFTSDEDFVKFFVP